MNLQYPDTLHLAISVSTTSSRFLLQFSSPILSLHFLLAFSSSVRSLIPFSSSVRSILPFSLIHSSFFHSSLSSSISIPSFILSSILSSILQTEGGVFYPIFHLPPVSVFRTSAEHSENKSNTGLALLQTVRWQPCVCKATIHFKTLKQMPLNRSADYRLRGADTLFRHLPPVSVPCSSAEHSENKSHTGFPLLQTAGGHHQSVKSHLTSKH